jgi:hypothetical protein
MSQQGEPLVAVDVADNSQLIDDYNTRGYPANFIFELCSYGNGIYYLFNQIPSSPTEHQWVGNNILDDNAVTSTASGPGPSEAFGINCRGPHEEFVNWQINGTDMFTVAGGAPNADPPTLWDHGPVGTLYQISGLCP